MSYLFKSVPELLKLWFHENSRVFRDRLINDEDRNWFSNLLKEKIKTNFSLDFKDVSSTDLIVYGDFIIPNADPRVYAEISDFTQVKKKIKL